MFSHAFHQLADIGALFLVRELGVQRVDLGDLPKAFLGQLLLQQFLGSEVGKAQFKGVMYRNFTGNGPGYHDWCTPIVMV